MRKPLILLLALVSASLAAEGPKVFILEGGTATNEKPILRTLRVETDPQGRVARVMTTSGKKLFTDFEVAYEEDHGRFQFTSLGGGGGVKIEVDLAWRQTSDSTWEIILNQSNDVPAAKIGKTTYPAKVYQRTRKILLDVSGKTYRWTDQVEASNFTSNDDPAQYTCTPGKSVVHEVRAADPSYNYRELLDSRSSDSSPVTSGRMVYTQVGSRVQGRLYWAMEPIEWDNGKGFMDGGSIQMSGDSLHSPRALVNVLNYSLLTVPFYQDAWTHFGPTLFGILIR